MNLYRNGFIVARMDNNRLSYDSWPLYDLNEDIIAQEFTNMANKTWFHIYDMQDIAPDLTYIKAYLEYCNKIELDVKILLFESLDNRIITDDKFEIYEVLGYDCIGTVYYSYLQTEYSQYPEMHEKGISQNKYGLLDNIEDILYFIKLRQQTIADGINIEDFYEELLVRISVVNIL